MKRLDRYIFRNVLAAILMVLLMLLVLDSILVLLDELDNMAADYRFGSVLTYIALLAPKKIYLFVPIAVLIGCLLGLGHLSSSNELVVTRSAGVSLFRLLYSAFRPAVVMIVLGVMLGEFVAPVTEQMGRVGKKIALSKDGKYTSGGVWHKEGNEYMRFSAVEPRGVLYGVSRYIFDDDHRLVASSRAKRAIYQGHHWVLEKVTESRVVDSKVISGQKSTQIWNTSLTPQLLKNLVLSADSLSISGLYVYVDYLEKQGLDNRDYLLAFWSKILQPLSIFALVLVGASFVFGPMRTHSVGLRLFAGVMTGILFMVMQELLGPSSLVFGFPPIIAVLIPPLLCIGVGSVLLYRAA